MSPTEHTPILPQGGIHKNDDGYSSAKNDHVHNERYADELKDTDALTKKRQCCSEYSSFDTLKSESPGGHQISPSVYVAAGCAALNSCNLGFDIGVNTDAAVLVQESMDLSNAKLEIFMGSMNFFAIVGAMLSAKIVSRHGLRGSFVVASGGFIIGLLIMVLSRSYELLMFGRIFVGLGVGFGMTIGPVYISEISPRSHRGYFVSWAEIGCNVGILLGFMVGFFGYRLSPNTGWRVMFGTGCIMPLAMAFLALFVMNESPRWLVQKGLDAEAIDVLRRLHRKGYDVEKTLREIKEDIEEEKRMSSLVGWNAILVSPSPAVKRMLLVGIGTAICQQMSGIDAIQYYLVFIMEEAGITDRLQQATFLTGLGLLKLSCIFVAGPLFDKIGRKPLICISLSGMAFALLLVASDFFSSTSHPPVVLGGLAIYLATFSLGIGPLAWIIPSEIFSTTIRSKAVALTTFVNRATATAVASSMLSIANAITWGWYFMSLAVICVLSVVFFSVFLPETKGRSLEEMSRYFAEITNDWSSSSTIVIGDSDDGSDKSTEFDRDVIELEDAGAAGVSS